MKLSLVKASGIVVLVAGMFSGAAFAGISTTKHNLTAGGNVFTPGGAGTAELCVFCHTPHAADGTAGSPPLWNRDVGALAGYQMYATSTIDGQSAVGGGLLTGSISVACLSCHDGTVAINTVINAPGSGYNLAWGSTGTWVSGGGIETTVGPNYGKMIGATTNIGADLKNDHPINIQYGGGPVGAIPAAPLPYPAGVASMKDPAFFGLKSVMVGATQNWYIDTAVGTNDVREKTDVLLYSRDSANTGYVGNEPFVECATCHDPHTANATFLRVSNAGSALCIACHDK